MTLAPNYLQFGDFLKRAAQRGLPATWRTWTRYEKQGLVQFRKLPNKWRIFSSLEEVDRILDEFIHQTSKK